METKGLFSGILLFSVLSSTRSKSQKIQFSVRDGQVKFKVSDSQNFWRGKGVCYQFYSEISGVADFSRMTRPKYQQDLHHWARRSVRSLDVQELTESNENKNAKTLNYWLYASLCRRLEISQVNDIPLGRLTINYCLWLRTFLVKKNGEGALNPLAVSDKRRKS